MKIFFFFCLGIVLRVLSAPVRYVKRKIESAYKKLVKKEPKKLLM